MEAWNRGASAKPKPVSTTEAATSSGPRSMLIPRASYTSAEPHWEDEARLPCFRTRTPPPASTRAAMLDTLIVPARSPPVPQVSTGSTPSGRVMRTAASSMA